MPLQETAEKKKSDAPAAAPEPENKPVPNAAQSAPPPPPKDGKRTDKLPVGIPAVGIEQQEREVGASDPPALPINAKLASIGKDTPRVDGRAKVTGAAKYTADINLPGMLYGRIITASVPHAKIKSIDISAAEKHPKVKAVHVLDRDRGAAQTEEEKNDKHPRVRYVGQPIAAVAAVTREDAEDAARLIKVEYEPLPWVVDTTKAMAPDAPVIFQGKATQSGSAGGGGGAKDVEQRGNVRGPNLKGDKSRLESAFADAEVTVEIDFKTQVQTHSALETHGVVVDYKPEQLTVWASTQGTSSVRDEFAAIFDMPKSKVRVITEYMGGGFGAKFGAGNFGALAGHLSKKAKAPVKLMLSRQQEHLCVGNRPDSYQKVKIGAKKDGTLTAIHVTNYGTGGTGGGAGATGPAQSMYPCGTIVVEDSDVFTNSGPAAAFRAPGHPQGAFAFEQAIDALAHKLGIDPLEFREKIDVSEARRYERKIGAEKIGWTDRKPPGEGASEGPIKRGVGFAQAIWYRFSSRDSHAEVRVTQDGSVEILSAVQDIGGGIRTCLAQVVAEELGLTPADINVKIGDTNYPAGPNSGGSVTTNSITPPTRDAAWQVKQQLLQAVAGDMGVGADQLEMKEGKIVAKSDPAKSMTFKAACRKIKGEQIAARVQRTNDYPTEKAARGGGSGGLGGVQFAQVSVDTETGVVQVEKVVAVHDCGRPINPMLVQSQVNGGVIQGLSYALYENRILDRNTAIMVNPNLEQYKIAGSKEMPIIEPIIIEQYWGRSSTDAAGIGEPCTVPTAAAIANAVYNAIGVRINEIPMTPAVVLAAIKSAQQSEKKGA